MTLAVEQINRPLTCEEAAQYLGLDYFTVAQWAREGKLKAYKLGRYWRFKIEDLDAALMEYQAKGGANEA